MIDSFDVRRARRAAGLLREFNQPGVLSAADVHVALTLAALGGERDESVALAAALAVRGPRLGHVFVDLVTIRDTAILDDESVDLVGLPWPATEAWVERVAQSHLVSVGEDDRSSRPLRLLGTRLYLDRYWREERELATDLQRLSDAPPAEVGVELLAEGLERLFAGPPDRDREDHVAGDRGPGDRGASDPSQRMAAAAAVLCRLSVIAGGPGTGKTSTVAGIIGLLAEQAAAVGAPPPLVALAAPTGKAAARLQESVHAQASGLPVARTVRDQLLALNATTLHRLLGWRPGSHSRFRHHRANRLAHDVVIVDETSMVSLSLMARLLEAVRPEARLILVGDPAQLSSIEAGAVLGDIVGPAAGGSLMRARARGRLAQATGEEVPAAEGARGGSRVPAAALEPPPGVTIGDGIVVLDRVHRFGGGIARLAVAIRRGDAGAVLEVLASAPDDVTWVSAEAPDAAAQDALAPVREGAIAAARTVIEAARAGESATAIEALGAFRVLCAHRRGPQGVAMWTSRMEGWLADELAGRHSVSHQLSYVGRPLLVTHNDYELRLYNGDTGVIVQAGLGRPRAVFARGGGLLELSPSRLAHVETVYAMSIHKSQGSQFATAAVLLPPPSSRLLSRELLYTGVTRARERLILVGSEDAIRAAVNRPVARASGLRGRLWGEA